MDFVEVAETLVLGFSICMNGDDCIAVTMDALYLFIGFLGIHVAVGYAILQQFFRQGDALYLVESVEVATFAVVSHEACLLHGQADDLPWCLAVVRQDP